jgi:hypothetical protein
LQQRFALVESRAMLEACRRDVQDQRDALVIRLGQAQSRPPASIERELARVDRELAQLTQEMRTQGHNLYQQLASSLPPDQLEGTEQGAGQPVLTLGADDFTAGWPCPAKGLG